MANLMEPHDGHAVQEQRHRRGAFDSQANAIGGILQAEKLFAVFKRAFDGPTTGVDREDLASVPGEIGAVERSGSVAGPPAKTA